MLERFHWRVPTVGHVRVGSAWAIGHRGSAHAARDGLVVCEWLAAHGIHSPEREIVHSARTGGGNERGGGLRDRTPHPVGYALRGFNIACPHGCQRARARQPYSL